jgi:hypothetical protein
MLPIQDSRISYENGKWTAKCCCGYKNAYSAKDSCLKMLERENCRHCKKDYRSVDSDVNIYKRFDGKWCSKCSGCNAEQAYTRKDHAKQSELADWQCKKCISKAKGFSENMPVGNVARLYNKFRKSANKRQIYWGISIKDFEGCYTGKCVLTGWEISMTYDNCTASLDRIDSSKGYEIDNIQWVHTMVNMCKNKYSQDKFVEMCKAVANKVKW